MIQRIQSIFLLIAAAAGFSLLAFPFATTSEAITASSLFADSNYSVNDNIGLLILFAVAGVLALASIFMFNNRPLQMKLCRIAIIADVIGLVLAIILLWQDTGVSGDSIQDGAGAYLPFVYLLFTILAVRYIKKDEKIVSSMDRLR